ncbi:exodeoxyribonuclease V subunit beta [Halomonas garicola]|uniref:exodeoxyribonuclease V subunit beta n=1 Tax=Halomonas garicola TaxID=1690008 RepID=UPI00289FE7AF|nr:exodeoxyribonuclease V subunit beta [Halomonas garicola]
MNPAILDPLTLPLRGSRLIEASAGTGKTFTIALLYVRLVLGGRDPDDASAFARPLTPPEILVMTFTNAATQELRERIRRRLVEASEAFAGEADAGTHDALLLALRAQYPQSHWPACARRLALAAEWMDEAAVSTIHSWCYRMLREHAFDSGSLFSLDLEHDQRELELEVVRDYWRCFYYSLDADSMGQISGYWGSPETLYAAVRPLLNESQALPDAPPPPDTLKQAQEERTRLLGELKAPWPAMLDEIEPVLAEAAQQKAFDGRKLRSDSRQKWLGALREWAENPAVDRPSLTDAAWKRLTPSGMRDIWKDGEPPFIEAWAAVEALPAALAKLPEPRANLLAHAVHWCRARLEREQERRAEMGPNDLLTHLDRALAGPNREALAEQIRRQFPVALVDEFQDTDPVQYRIFNAVYDIATDADDRAIMLIGDPKQAIYAFRGADIFTYLQAREDTAGRHVTLGTNFRSSEAMVAAVNHCFAYADKPADANPSGAFMFRDGDHNPLPFVPVSARGRDDTLTLDGDAVDAMTLWRLDSDDGKPLGKGAYQNAVAQSCASHMVRLLNAGQRGQAGFAKGDANESDALTPLRPSDMAVLVNNGTEAGLIRNELSRRGVKSVYLSEQDKVFSSPVAAQVALWLAACSEPLASSRQAQSRVRAALATRALGLSFARLDHLQHNELAWEAEIKRFSDYHRLWQRQGVLPLLRRIMVDFAVPARLLGQSGAESRGERELTDLLHLGELLQAASQELDGEHALLRFLDEAIADPDGYGDSHRLRLESDADLVKVVTIHKSKGLEYPLVFLPFIANHRPTKDSDSPLRWHDNNGTLRISLVADDAVVDAVDRERLGEDMRKLYVALTRASHAVWLGLAPLKDMDKSAVGHLLGGQSIDNGALEALVEGSEIALEPAPEASDERFTPPLEAAELAPARTPKRRAKEHWWIASYSALTLSGALTRPADLSPAAAEPATAQDATALEVIDEPRDVDTTSDSAAHLHRFPRGPGPGTFLHGLLEWAGREGFAKALNDAEALDDTLRRRLQLRGWQSWHEVLGSWLGELAAAPLPLPAVPETPPDWVTLTELGDYQVELEFWFSAGRVDTRELDRIVCAHLMPGIARPALERDTLNGMLKGFIDLAFAHRGRFYVLDWKSNYLGRDDDAYSAEAMRRAVLDKRYDVQSALYLLAMHRLLKARLTDYNPEHHLGGAMTVFLRGSRTQARGVHAEPATAALVNDLDALFSPDATRQEAS